MKRLLDIYSLNRVSVLGMGKSGFEVAKFFKNKGIPVFLSDSGDGEKLSSVTSKLDELDIEYETGGHSDRVWQGVDLAVISPGIPLDIPVVKLITQKGVPIISELELAYRLSEAPFIAITGTNGKSTTTTMIGEFLTAGGKSIILGGNIGIPLVEKAYNAREDQIIVAEVSSFQLETVEDFSPFISLLLNISSDHLNRHGTMENYLNLKARIFEKQGKDSHVVLNYDDPEIRSLAGRTSASVHFFSTAESVVKGISLNNGKIYYKNGDSEFDLCSPGDIPVPGEHNLRNTMAAMVSSLLCGVKKEVLRESIAGFKGLKHRMEHVTVVKGVRFIDDSKGTNPDAVMSALNSFEEPLVLIAGGVDKNMDFSGLCDLIARRVKGLVLIGSTADILCRLCMERGLSNIVKSPTMEDAVERAFYLSEPGNVVLLSPAGASFDMFKNAEERGDRFSEAVHNLKKQIENHP